MNNNPKLPSGVRSAGAGRRGQLLGKDRNPLGWRVCAIWDYYPQTQTYSIVDGQAGVVHDVIRVVQDPGEVGILPRDTQVVVHNELGFPAIIGVKKGSATSSVEVNPARISEIRGIGGEDGVYAQTNPASDARTPNDPIDVIADDWIRKGRHNNLIGVLAGGTNVMKSAPMAQIRTHGLNSMVEVMANVYRHISSMGNLEINNDGGKTSLTWRAGADQSTENGANAENWTLRLDAGAAGDLFRFSVTTPNNNTLCEIHMSADGRLSITGVAGVDLSSGDRGTAREDVAENKEVSVQGEMSTEVKGAVTETLGSSKVTQIATNSTISTGNDLKETVGHDRLTHITNKLTTTVEGGPLTPPPSPGNLAIIWDGVNGGIESVTGDPLKGGLPSLQQAQNFVNYAGSFNFALQPTAADGKFNVISNNPDSVLLGASGAAVPGANGHTFTAIAPFHTMMFEFFQTMMTTMLTWMDTHTHLSAMGPTGPAAAGTAGPVTPQVQPLLQPIKSLRVCIGG